MQNNNSVPELVYEEPKWYVNGCRIFNKGGEFIGYFKDKYIGREIVDILNNIKNKEDDAIIKSK